MTLRMAAVKSVALASALAFVVAACGTSHQAEQPRTAAAPPVPTAVARVVTLPALGRTHWWYGSGGYPDGRSHCGAPAAIRVAGVVSHIGDCADLFVPGRTVHLRVGAALDIHVLDPRSLPRSSTPALEKVAVSPDGATARYVGVRAGTAELVTSADCLYHGDETAGCEALSVVIGA